MPAELARRMLLLLGDAQLRGRFGRFNRERVDRQFRWERAARRVCEIYEEVLEEWKRGTGRAMKGQAERFFRDTDYWQAWSEVPDLTVDIDYALRAVRPEDRSVLDVPCGRGRLLKAVAGGRPAPRSSVWT